MIELTDTLTEDEQAMLAEVDECEILTIPGRRIEGYTDEDRRRTEILKALVYKDLINFSIPGRDKAGHYVFFSRKIGGRI